MARSYLSLRILSFGQVVTSSFAAYRLRPTCQEVCDDCKACFHPCTFDRQLHMEATGQCFWFVDAKHARTIKHSDSESYSSIGTGGGAWESWSPSNSSLRKVYVRQACQGEFAKGHVHTKISIVLAACAAVTRYCGDPNQDIAWIAVLHGKVVQSLLSKDMERTCLSLRRSSL